MVLNTVVIPRSSSLVRFRRRRALGTAAGGGERTERLKICQTTVCWMSQTTNRLKSWSRAGSLSAAVRPNGEPRGEGNGVSASAFTMPYFASPEADFVAGQVLGVDGGWGVKG